MSAKPIAALRLKCVETATAVTNSPLRGQTISAATARSFFDLLEDVNFQHVVDIRGANLLFDDAWNMGCGSYDAAYLRAAVDNHAQLATLDRKLLPHLPGQGITHWQA